MYNLLIPQIFRIQLVKQEVCVHSHVGRTENESQVFPSVNKCSSHRVTQKWGVLLPALLFLQQLCEPCSSLFFYSRFNRVFCVEKSKQKIWQSQLVHAEALKQMLMDLFQQENVRSFISKFHFCYSLPLQLTNRKRSVLHTSNKYITLQEM